MKERFITVTGVNYCYGMKPLCVGAVVRCVKEPDNAYDGEAIRVEMPWLGQVGYVANSPRTCANGTMSAGRVYDAVGQTFFARVMFTTQTKVIARVLEAGADELARIFESQGREFYGSGAGEEDDLALDDDLSALDVVEGLDDDIFEGEDDASKEVKASSDGEATAGGSPPAEAG